MTLVMTVIVAVVLIALVLTGPLAEAIGAELGIGDTAVTVFSIVKWPLLFAIVVARDRRCSTASRPNARHAGLRWILPGSAARDRCSGSLASAGFSLYVANFGSYSNTYGSLAGAIVFLIWLWLTNLAIVFGAQFAAELERTGRAAEHATPPGGFAPFVSPAKDADDARGRRTARQLRTVASRPPPEDRRERRAPSGPLSKLRSMSSQGQIEALQAPARSRAGDGAAGPAPSSASSPRAPRWPRRSRFASASGARARRRRLRPAGRRRPHRHRRGGRLGGDRRLLRVLPRPARSSSSRAGSRSTPSTAPRSRSRRSAPPTPASIEHDDLAEGPPVSVEQLEAELRELLATIQNPQLARAARAHLRRRVARSGSASGSRRRRSTTTRPTRTGSSTTPSRSPRR